LPDLVIATKRLTLNDELFCIRQKRQEDINVDVVISQMADGNAGRTCLRCVVPNDVPITRIAASCSRIGTVQEQIG
jgi:hypothetical protein